MLGVNGVASSRAAGFGRVQNHGYLDFHVADADLRLVAPQAILDVVDRMLASVPRRWSRTHAALEISVDDAFGVWQIDGRGAASSKTLSHAVKTSQVGGAAVGALLAELSHFRGLSVWRAAVVNRRGRALALVGDDWESVIALTAHLHARGWRIISGDYALVDLATMCAVPFRKLLHFSSATVASLPVCYRRSIEASPWYVSPHAISFYAVDPTLVDGFAAWGESAAIDAILKIDGRMGEQPSLEDGGDFAISSALCRRALPAQIASAMLTLGRFIDTADLVERWFDAPAGRS